MGVKNRASKFIRVRVCVLKRCHPAEAVLICTGKRQKWVPLKEILSRRALRCCCPLEAGDSSVIALRFGAHKSLASSISSPGFGAHWEDLQRLQQQLSPTHVVRCDLEQGHVTAGGNYTLLAIFFLPPLHRHVHDRTHELAVGAAPARNPEAVRGEGASPRRRWQLVHRCPNAFRDVPDLCSTRV